VFPQLARVVLHPSSVTSAALRVELEAQAQSLCA